MKNLIVVNHVQQWPGEIAGVEMVAAQNYLTDPYYASATQVRIYNLCDSYGYQRLGYYVSLLAEARDQKAVPRARTIEDLQSANLVRLLTEGLEKWVQFALQDQTVSTIEWDFYFGFRTCASEDVLGQQLFQLLKAPLLRAQFEKPESDGKSSAPALYHWTKWASRPFPRFLPQQSSISLDAVTVMAKLLRVTASRFCTIRLTHNHPRIPMR